jgi:hypothetical protein
MERNMLDVVTEHLESIGAINIKTVDNEKVYSLSDEFRTRLSKALENPDIQQASNPTVSAIILCYLSFLDDISYAYELHTSVNVLWKIYEGTKK